MDQINEALSHLHAAIAAEMRAKGQAASQMGAGRAPVRSRKNHEDWEMPLKIWHFWSVLASLVLWCAVIGALLYMSSGAHAEVFRRICHYSSDPRIPYEVTIDDGEDVDRPSYGTLIAGQQPNAVITPIQFTREDIAGSQAMIFFRRMDNGYKFAFAVNPHRLEGRGEPKPEQLLTERNGVFVVDDCGRK